MTAADVLAVLWVPLQVAGILVVIGGTIAMVSVAVSALSAWLRPAPEPTPEPAAEPVPEAGDAA